MTNKIYICSDLKKKIFFFISLPCTLSFKNTNSGHKHGFDLRFFILFSSSSSSSKSPKKT